MTTASRTAAANERLMRVSRRTGCPRDQIQRFLTNGYVPQPKQLEFHAAARAADHDGGPTEIGFGGARGPGKSHAVFAQAALDDCQRVDGLKVLYLRKIAKNAREQMEDLRKRVLRFCPHTYRSQAGVIEFPNGSQILVGHFKSESDVDNYLGLEYDLIVIEEATTLTRLKYQALRDSCRTSKGNWRPRIYTTTNPGGVGHAWFKQTFIEPARSGVETFTRFIFATVDDNTFINQEYIDNLDRNTGWRYRAYRLGDWDIAAGQFFTTWRHDVHVIQPFEIPLTWPVWMAMDYGFIHWNVVYLLAESHDGIIYHVDEHAARNWLPERHAGAVRAMLQRWDIEPWRVEAFVTGADSFVKRAEQRNGEAGASIADHWLDEGFTLSPANQDRINGAAEYLRRLGDVDAGIPPRMYVFGTCARLIECIPALEHDPRRPEDVLKWDTDEDGQGGDDPYDASRYGIMARAALAGDQDVRRTLNRYRG